MVNPFAPEHAKSKVPDDPSVKVFSKKKAAERSQHNLRSFSVQLRSTAIAAAKDGAGVSLGAVEDEGKSVKISVPMNLPVDANEVVNRLRWSLQAFKQVRV